MPPVKLKLPILADVNAPILVRPTPADPVIISTPLNLSELAPVKLRLTLDVHAFVPLRHKSSLLPLDDATIIPASSTPTSSSSVLSSPFASSILLSLTNNFCTSSSVVSPSTIKFPATRILPPTSNVSDGVEL